MRANAYKRTETYSAYRCRQPDSSFQNKVCSSCETNATLCDAIHFKLNSWTPSLLLVSGSQNAFVSVIISWRVLLTVDLVVLSLWVQLAHTRLPFGNLW